MEALLGLLEKVNVIDILFIASAAFGFIFGLMGKAGKKITHLLTTVICIAIAYFTCGMVAEKLYTMDSGFIPSLGQAGVTIKDLLAQKIAASVPALANADLSALDGMIMGILKLVVFWLGSIGLLLTLGLLIRIIAGIVAMIAKKKKHTAIFTLGIPGIIRSVLITVVCFFPLLALAPVAGTVKAIPGVGDNQIVTVVLGQLEKSKVVGVSTEVLSKVEIEPLTYTYTVKENGEDVKKKQSLYKDFEGLGDIMALAGTFLSGDTSNISLATFKEMDKEQLKAAFTAIENSPLKETIGSVLGDALPVDVAEIDFEKEADTIIVILDLVEMDDSGNMTGLDTSILEDETKLAETAAVLASSDLIYQLMSSDDAGSGSLLPEGALADLDTNGTVKTAVQDALVEKGLTADSEQYKAFMKLFEKPASDDTQGGGDQQPGGGDQQPGGGDTQQ